MIQQLLQLLKPDQFSKLQYYLQNPELIHNTELDAVAGAVVAEFLDRPEFQDYFTKLLAISIGQQPNSGAVSPEQLHRGLIYQEGFTAALLEVFIKPLEEHLAITSQDYEE